MTAKYLPRVFYTLQRTTWLPCLIIAFSAFLAIFTFASEGESGISEEAVKNDTEQTFTPLELPPQPDLKTTPVDNEPPVEYEPDISELTLQEAMGYQIIESADGPKMIYNPSMDQSLQGTLKLSPITASYAEIEMQHVQRVFHEFLSTRLTPSQRKLLQLYLVDELTQSPAAAASHMADELNQDALSPESTAFMAKVVLALYYYHMYIYKPLLDYSTNSLNNKDQEGLMIPHVITMTQHILNQFSHSKPLINALLIAPLVTTHLYRNFQNNQISSMGVAASSYAATLALTAQFSAGILGRYTTFNSYAAGMLSSTYRSWIQKDHWQALIDGMFTFHYAKNKRPIILTALGAAFLQSMNLKPSNTTIANLMNANYMMPLILSVCLTQDWSSTFITGATLLFNQFAIYRTRDAFIQEQSTNLIAQPYWKGLLGTGIALAFTTGMYWNEFPTYQQMGHGITSVTTTLSEWLGYLTFMKGLTRPDWERSGVIHSISRFIGQISPFQTTYPGDQSVITSHNFDSKAAAIEGNQPSMIASLTEWMSTLFGAGTGHSDLPTHTTGQTPSSPAENTTIDEHALESEISSLIEDIRSDQEGGSDTLQEQPQEQPQEQASEEPEDEL